MKFKVFYFLLPLATAATLFAFCTKEPTVPAVESKTVVDEKVIDRTKCPVTVTVNNGTVNVCGTGTMLTACDVLGNGEVLRGVENLTAPAVRNYGVQTDDGPTADGYMKFTNNGPTAFVNVTVTTASGSVTFNVAGAPVLIKFDSNCVPTIV